MTTDTKPTIDEIAEAIVELLGNYNPDGIELSTKTDLNADLAIDSVSAMDLIMDIEDRFDIDIPINLVSEVRTVTDLARVAEAQIGA